MKLSLKHALYLSTSIALAVSGSRGNAERFADGGHALIAQAPGGATVVWNKSLQSTLKQAAAQRKWVFVEITASWCPTCRALDGEILTDRSVQNFLASNYLCVRLDGDSAYGTSMKQRYKMRGVPSLMVFAPTGRLQGATAGGAGDAADFIDMVTRMTRGESHALTREF